MAPRAKGLLFKLLVGVFLWMALLGSLPASVKAEVFLDFYGGLAMTDSGKVKGKETFVPFLGIGPTTTRKFRQHVDFKNSFSTGARFGYWIERFPWLGGAIDASFFEANAKNADINIPVGALSFLLMFRYPLLVNEQFPKGRLQPYVGIGPELAFSEISAEFRENGSGKIKEFATGIGLDLRTGFLWQFHRHWGFFAEYRLTHVKLEADKDDDDVFFGGYALEEIQTTLTTHHFLGGISFRF